MVGNGTVQVHLGIARRLGFTAPSSATLGALAAWVAVVIYAASNSIVTLLVNIGEANPTSAGTNAITYTNLYLLGSLISLLPMALLYRRDLTRANLRRLTPYQWRLLGISAVLSSVLTPALFFYALEHTTVTNIVLVGRIEPPLFLLATWFFLRERLNPWAMLAGLIALAGAIVIIGTGTSAGAFTLGKGEVATVAATLSFIASTIVTRAGLRDVPIGIFAVFRTGLGASLYFVLVSAFFGLGTFRDVFEPVVWQWVWVYAIVVIVLGQIAWNYGLKYARAGDVSLATSFSPLAAILIAMVLLGEDPGPGLIPGAIIILIAIVIGNLRLPVRGRPAVQPSHLTGCIAEYFNARRSVRPYGDTAPAGNFLRRDRVAKHHDPTFLSSVWGTNPSSQGCRVVQNQRGLAERTPELEKMESKMKKLLATAAVGIALSAPAFATSDETTDEATQAANEAAQETAQATEDAIQETEQATEELAQEAKQAAEDAAEATDQAATEAEQAAEQAATEAEQATDPAAAEAEAGAETELAEGDSIAVDGYAMVDAAKMTAEELSGAAVYDSSQEWIGEVSEIVFADDGKINTVVVDVGGFLGLGEKPVGLDYEKINVLKGEEGGDLRVHVKSSKEELESMPEYEG